jgi:hypothetical protein
LVLFSLNVLLWFLKVYLVWKFVVAINWPIDAMSWLTSCNGKIVWRTFPFKMSKPHSNRWEGGCFFKVVFPPLEVLAPGYGWI